MENATSVDSDQPAQPRSVLSARSYVEYSDFTQAYTLIR